MGEEERAGTKTAMAEILQACARIDARQRIPKLKERLVSEESRGTNVSRSHVQNLPSATPPTFL